MYGDERLPDFVRTGPIEGAPAPLSIGTFRRSRRDISVVVLGVLNEFGVESLIC